MPSKNVKINIPEIRTARKIIADFIANTIFDVQFDVSLCGRTHVIVLNLIPHDKSVEVISAQIIELKKEQNVISMVDEFAKHAKLQRRINKLLDEKKTLASGRAAEISKLKYLSLFITYGIIAIILFILVWMYKGEAVAQLPKEWLWPFPNMFSWFSTVPGCISVPSWIIISSAASKTIAKIL